MRFATILSAALLASSACSDATGPTIALSEQEVGQLFTELTKAIADSMPAAPEPDGGASAASVTVSLTRDCVGGGTVGLNGTVSANNTVVSANIVETFTACVTESFTVGGALQYLATINASNDSSLTMHQTLRGSIDVTHQDGRTGHCGVNVVLDLSVNGQNVTAIAKGEICGRSADAALSSTVSG